MTRGEGGGAGEKVKDEEEEGVMEEGGVMGSERER